MSVYIDVTCDDKLDRLIITGNPSREMLEETRSKLAEEFSLLTGNAEMKLFVETSRNYFNKRNVILGMELSARLTASGKYESAIEFLNKNGIECTPPGNPEQADRLIEKINLKLKNLLSKFRSIEKNYKSLQGKGEKPTRKYYNRLLVVLSTCEAIKMQLDRNRLTLSEFAEYINIFNEYANHLKSIKNGRKH